MLTLGATLLMLQAVPAGQLVRREIVFDARATVEDFQGHVTDATGEQSGGADLAAARGWVEVPWRAIDTRNGTRNRHMLKTVDEARYPVIRFDLAEVVADTAVGHGLAVRLRGTLALHGMSRDVEWPAVVSTYPDSVTVDAGFPVDMREYGIKPPVRFVIARMGAVVQVRVRLVFALQKREAGNGKREASDTGADASPFPLPPSRQ